MAKVSDSDPLSPLFGLHHYNSLIVYTEEYKCRIGNSKTISRRWNTRMRFDYSKAFFFLSFLDTRATHADIKHKRVTRIDD